MSRIRHWLEATACPILDFSRNERVEEMARQVVRCMRREGSFFSFRDTTSLMNVPLEDLALVKERVYELTLKYVMEDYRIDQRDRQGLGWIARHLRLESKDARWIELRVGRKVFDEYLAFAIAGGHLSQDEIAEFRTLAESLRTTTRQLLLLFLAESGEKFLEMILEALSDRQTVEQADWGQLTASLAALGLKEEELIRILRAQAGRLQENLAATHRRTPQMENQQRVLQLLLDLFEARESFF